MSKEKLVLYAIRLPKIYLVKMRLTKRTKYISISEQVRIALRDYFDKIDKKK